jgi:hypothetical protein
MGVLVGGAGLTGSTVGWGAVERADPRVGLPVPGETVSGQPTTPAVNHHLRDSANRDTRTRQVDRNLEAPRSRSRPIPESGSGHFVEPPAPQVSETAATTYTVQIERELPFAPELVADFVDSVLADARGWAAAGHRLARADEGELRIVLATPRTADRLCAPLVTLGRLSCRNGADVVINGWRWRNGAGGYERRLRDYRAYVINHEVGHALGYRHVACPGAKLPAPVMQQQTKGLDGCRPNPWPAIADLAAH